MIKFIILFSLLSYQLTYADEIGIITKIIDGDTLYLNSNGEEIKIRLQYIDAPELNQSFGKESQLILESLVLNKLIIFKGSKKDRYHRLLGILFLNDEDINLHMIKIGAAWHYKKYAKFDQAEEHYLVYDEYEHQAQLKKIGLWKENAISPWLWRKNKK
jgi:micrococcal nuclease